MFTISEIENNLVGLSHGATLNKVRNKYHLYERAANNLLSKIRPLETVRIGVLAQTVHSNEYDYALPSDFRDLIGVYPQPRYIDDKVQRIAPDTFDRRKSIDNKKITIEGKNGAKIIRIAYDVEQPIVFSTMDSYNGNGTWVAVGSASGIKTDTVFKYSGGGSVRFTKSAANDGIKNTTLSAVDLTDVEQIADIYVVVYFTELPAASDQVSIIFGNDLTTNYWTPDGVSTQADGTPFVIGWNILKFDWAHAVETGSVNPATIDSMQITFDSTTAGGVIRVDNILFSVGFPFDIKYHSKYAFQTSSGTWISQPTTDSDLIVLDSDAYNIFLYECLDEMGFQVEGEDAQADQAFARKKLYGDPQAMDYAGRAGLYAEYKGKYPSNDIQQVASTGFVPRFNRK